MKARSINNLLICITMLISLKFSININKRFETKETKHEFHKLYKNRVRDPSLTNSKQFTSLTINPPPGKSGIINLKLKKVDKIYSLGLVEQKFQLNSNSNNILSATNELVQLQGQSILTNSLEVNGSVNFNDISQWRMIEYNSWASSIKKPEGWNFSGTTTCGGVTMLGGKCKVSSTEIVKTISYLPEHTMVRIEGLFHFMGSWQSETGYLKLWSENDYKQLENTNKYLWTMRCKKDKSTPLVNIKICEEESCKVGSPISITIPHKEKEIRISFGSTLSSNSCEKSFGISDVKFYIR